MARFPPQTIANFVVTTGGEVLRLQQAGNANALAVRQALGRRSDEALAAFDARGEIGVLGVPTRTDTVEGLSELVRSGCVEPLRKGGKVFRNIELCRLPATAGLSVADHLIG
ncbi:hypothetical protein ACIBG0_05900 [Nocardia sp. NPDC050630]|uniref:hypothetical protein n=1 Tax=Nocardia sp. NPDC050630 TaxID=3364321 RepID=UPI0037A8930E